MLRDHPRVAEGTRKVGGEWRSASGRHYAVTVDQSGAGPLLIVGRYTPRWKRATLFQKSSLWLTCDVGCRGTVALRPWRYGQLVRFDFSGNAALI